MSCFVLVVGVVVDVRVVLGFVVVGVLLVCGRARTETDLPRFLQVRAVEGVRGKTGSGRSELSSELQH